MYQHSPCCVTLRHQQHKNKRSTQPIINKYNDTERIEQLKCEPRKFMRCFKFNTCKTFMNRFQRLATAPQAAIPALAPEDCSASFSKLNKVFFGYLDPENNFF